MNTLSNKRKWPRKDTQSFLVSFEQIAGQGTGDIKNYSNGGLAMKTIENMEMGAITMRFKMPFFEKRATVHGEVVWLDSQSFTCGISFHIGA